MIVDPDLGTNPEDVAGVETGLCFFADKEIDQSPTASCVTARIALAYAKGVRPVGQRWAYHSLVSFFGTGAFSAEIVEKVKIPEAKGISEDGVVVQVEGHAYYTGTSVFVVEEGDVISSGFTMESVTSRPAEN